LQHDTHDNRVRSTGQSVKIGYPDRPPSRRVDTPNTEHKSDSARKGDDSGKRFHIKLPRILNSEF
jgi:hypothetical protein